MDQIKASGLLGLNVSDGKKSVKFVIPKDDKTYDYLLKLEEYGLIESLIKHSSKNKFDDNYTFLTCPMFDSIFTSLEKLLDDPFLATNKRNNKIRDLLSNSTKVNRKDTSRNIYSYGNLSIDTKRGILVFKGYSFTINPETFQMKMIIELIKANGEIISYKDLFKRIGKRDTDEEKIENKDYAKDLQDIRKSIKDYLDNSPKISSPHKKSVSKLMQSIKSVTNKGYRLIKS